MNRPEYSDKAKLIDYICERMKEMDGVPRVILPLMKEGSLDMSAKVAMGIDQFAAGPQKCVLPMNHEQDP